MKHTPHSCDALGVCQTRTPCCNGCRRMHHLDDQVESPWDWAERVSFAVVLVIVIMCTATLVAKASDLWR